VISDCGEIPAGADDGFEAAYAGDTYPSWPEDAEKEFTADDLIKVAELAKQKGIEAFQRQHFRTAIAKYEKVVLCL
jgi:peptidyl-prolyl isomerase D